MSRRPVRLTKVQRPQEDAMKQWNSPDHLDQWLELSIEDIEYRLRYSKEETQVLQGALRALDELKAILNSE